MFRLIAILISSRDVIAKWPQELIAYLESQIVFKAPTRMVSFFDEVELNQNHIIGQPTNILGLYFFLLFLKVKFLFYVHKYSLHCDFIG